MILIITSFFLFSWWIKDTKERLKGASFYKIEKEINSLKEILKSHQPTTNNYGK